MTYKLSPSSIKYYRDCPRCFWLKQNKGIERPEGIMSSYPMGVDLNLKRYLSNQRTLGIMPQEIKELIGSEMEFYIGDELKTWQTNLKGIQTTDKKGNILRGAVDEMFYKNGKLVVVDFKTRGFLLKDKVPDYYQDQMDIYNFLLRQNGKETEDYTILLFYSPNHVEGRNFVQNIEFVKMNTDPRRAEELFTNVIDLLEGPMPDPRRIPKKAGDKKDEGCNYCTWYEKIKELGL